MKLKSVLVLILVSMLLGGCGSLAGLSVQSAPDVWAFTVSYEGSGVEYTPHPTVGQAAAAAEKGWKWTGVAYSAAQSNCETLLAEARVGANVGNVGQAATITACRRAVVLTGSDYWVFPAGNAVHGATPQGMCDLMRQIENRSGRCRPIALRFVAPVAEEN